MIIKDVQIVEFRGEEKSGYDHDGNPYRSRTAEIRWPDEDGKRWHRAMGRLRTQPCDALDNMGLDTESFFTADISFDVSMSHSGYKFINCYINKIL